MPATGATLTNAWACDVDDDGSTLAVVSWAPPQLNFFDVPTMSFLQSVALPGGSNIYTCVWR